MPMKRAANRFITGDPDQHARVAHAGEYTIETPLYQRRVGNGTITCRMMRSPTPAKRIVQLVADYHDGGIQTTRVCQCESEQEEVRDLQRLERLILEASRRPSR
jgi:hypothetical protein